MEEQDKAGEMARAGTPPPPFDTWLDWAVRFKPLDPQHQQDRDKIAAARAELSALRASHERMREALNHAVHRNHEYSRGCDGCLAINAALPLQRAASPRLPMVSKPDPDYRPKGLAHAAGRVLAFVGMAFIGILVVRALWWAAGQVLGLE